MLSLAEDD